MNKFGKYCAQASLTVVEAPLNSVEENQTLIYYLINFHRGGSSVGWHGFTQRRSRASQVQRHVGRDLFLAFLPIRESDVSTAGTRTSSEVPPRGMPSKE